MTDKWFINANSLFEYSVDLAEKIIQSGFQPNYIVGIWRGGTPVGIVVQEILEYRGLISDHISIRTRSYEGEERNDNAPVKVFGLEYLVNTINSEDALLIVDDVFDTGLSIQAMLGELKVKCRKNYPHDVRIATPFYKPENNQTSMSPDYVIHETKRWLVFPHELSGLDSDEIRIHKPYIYKMLQSL